MTRYSKLYEFAEATKRVGGVEGIWGFVDGTFRGHCRPGDNRDQQIVYSGHKRAHGMNWQAITTPDGLISSLVGPYVGANNDWSMWKRSGCKEEIRRVMSGHPTLYIYGDLAYNASFGVACPYKHPYSRRYLTTQEQDFNQALSSVRIAIEQAFGDIQIQWTYTAFAKGLNSRIQPIRAYFTTAILLTNCFIYVRIPRNRFQITPISIEDYLY